MTDTEQPDTPPLTRKQLREIRNTGATPVISADAAAASSPVEPPASVEPPAAPLPRAAEPIAVAPAPIADAAVDLGVSPLTRRQARQQERIRTASVPVITPDVAAAHAASLAPAAPISSVPGVTVEAETEPVAEDETRSAVEPAAQAGTDDVSELFAPPVEQDDTAVEAEAETDVEGSTQTEQDDAERTVSPLLGASVIAGEPVEIDLPPSFDQLLARGSTGSIGTPNALILSQATGDLPIVAPVTATGEVIVTGTFNLPDGLGSTGHAAGTADGKEVDAVLVDGELPAHSSPTPIAASAAISTVKSAGEVIRPPAPEKGSKLMLWLAITAGALALALVGVLILAFTTGVL